MNSAYHKHHRKLRSHGGSGEWGNMIELPAWVHSLVHENPEVAYEHGLLVKSYDDPHQIIPDVRGFLTSLGYDGELTKPKRKKLEGEARRRRKRISIAVPADSENGGQLWDSMLEMVKQRLVEMGRYSAGDKIPAYEALMSALYDWYTNA